MGTIIEEHIISLMAMNKCSIKHKRRFMLILFTDEYSNSVLEEDFTQLHAVQELIGYLIVGMWQLFLYMYVMRLLCSSIFQCCPEIQDHRLEIVNVAPKYKNRDLKFSMLPRNTRTQT